MKIASAIFGLLFLVAFIVFFGIGLAVAWNIAALLKTSGFTDPTLPASIAKFIECWIYAGITGFISRIFLFLVDFK